MELRALFSLDEWTFIQGFRLRVRKKHQQVLTEPPVLPNVQQGEQALEVLRAPGV